MSNQFSKITPASGGDHNFLCAGSGPSVIVLQSAEDFGPKPFHDLLADQCNVTLVAPKTARSFTAGDVAAIAGAIDPVVCSVICEGASASAGLAFAQAEPDAVSRLILQAPTGAVEREYAEILTPTLVLESSKVAQDHIGQQLAAVLPHCFHVFVFDADETAPIDRAEAGVEVVADFIDRGGSFILKKPQAVLYP